MNTESDSKTGRKTATAEISCDRVKWAFMGWVGDNLVYRLWDWDARPGLLLWVTAAKPSTMQLQAAEAGGESIGFKMDTVPAALTKDITFRVRAGGLFEELKSQLLDHCRYGGNVAYEALGALFSLNQHYDAENLQFAIGAFEQEFDFADEESLRDLKAWLRKQMKAEKNGVK